MWLEVVTLVYALLSAAVAAARLAPRPAEGLRHHRLVAPPHLKPVLVSAPGYDAPLAFHKVRLAKAASRLLCRAVPHLGARTKGLGRHGFFKYYPLPGKFPPASDKNER